MNYRQLTQAAAEDTIHMVHAYMRANPHSELHRQGKMFGVLLCADPQGVLLTLRAFSAKLDNTYYHEGFVPPVYAMTEPPVGSSREESRRLQRLLFAQYRLTNARGETRDLLQLFADRPPILSPEEWFSRQSSTFSHPSALSAPSLPPSGAGECCAPKLLQYAFSRSLRPLVLAEFWVGAPSRTEIRREGVFYPPCSGKCAPILRHMLQGIELDILRTDTLYPVPDSTDISILYDDDSLVVVDKPAGLLSVPGRTDEPDLVTMLTGNQAFADYSFYHAPLYPAHRLDRDTGGILVLAKTPEAYQTLQTYFLRRDILKRYEALLLPAGNRPVPDEGTVTLPLLPDPFDRPRQMVSLAHGKPSVTAYRVRERRPDHTLFVDFFPHTGRTHQLRVHAAHPDGLDAPILGDRLYGRALTDDAHADPGRLCLHAAEIRFPHPLTKEEMHFCIPSPWL